MTVEDTKATLKLLKAAYPQFYKNMKFEDAQGIYELWIEEFQNDDVGLVKMALKLIIESDREFPPTIGTIKSKMDEIERAITNEKTDEDYWLELKNAVCNGGYYGCVEAFKKLSPVVKRYCGSPSTIRDYAKMDESSFNTYVHSNFLKTIGTIREKEKICEKIPEVVKEKVLLERNIEQEYIPDESIFNDKRNEIFKKLNQQKGENK